jgi:hypothetical protein
LPRALLALLLAASLSAAAEHADLLPQGLSMAGEVEEYTPDTLFEYINGAARMYNSYGFVGLTHARYLHGEDGATIDLDIYDMGSKLGAYGIYSNGRPPRVETKEWGSQGYRSGKIAVAWKGRLYIRVAGSMEMPELDAIVAGVAAKAPGDASLPDLALLLPTHGFVANSDRYVARDLLGHSFLPGGMLARYRAGEEEYSLFLCELDSSNEAAEAVASLREYEEKEGTVLDHSKDGFTAEDPGLGRMMVTRSGRFVAGVWGFSSKEPALRTLRSALSSEQ